MTADMETVLAGVTVLDVAWPMAWYVAGGVAAWAWVTVRRAWRAREESDDVRLASDKEAVARMGRAGGANI